MAIAADALEVDGTSRQMRSASYRGPDAVRNFCPHCGGLVFGGVLGEDTQHTVYAGSLDDPEVFKPTIAIFVRDLVPWVVLPPGLTRFEIMPE